MDLGKSDSFLFNMVDRRFRETLKELAESDGIDSRFVERVMDRYLANPGALGGILSEYPHREDELRLGCLLRASREVHKEILQHFEPNRKADRKALIHEMPTDKYLRLKLQAEYILRYVRGIDEEELPKVKEAGLLRDKLLEAIKQVERVKMDREEISQQIRAEVQTEVASRSMEIAGLSREMESQQNEIRKVGNQVEDIKKSRASVEELQSVKDMIQSDREHSNEALKQLNELLREKASRREVEYVRSSLSDYWDALDEWKRQQTTFNDRVQRLDDRVKGIDESMAFSREEVEVIKAATASAEELKAIKNILQQDRQHSREELKQLGEQLREKPSRQDVEDVKLKLTGYQAALNEWKGKQTECSGLVSSLTERVESVAASVMSSREEVDKRIDDLLGKAPEEVKKKVLEELEESLCKDFRERLELCGKPLASAEELNRLEQRVVNLKGGLDQFPSDSAVIQQVGQLIKESLKCWELTPQQIQSAISHLGNLEQKHNHLEKRIEQVSIEKQHMERTLKIHGEEIKELKDTVVTRLTIQSEKDGSQPSISAARMEQLRVLAKANEDSPLEDVKKTIALLVNKEVITKEEAKVVLKLWEEGQNKQ